MREILTRLQEIEGAGVEIKIFGDKVILDEGKSGLCFYMRCAGRQDCGGRGGAEEEEVELTSLDEIEQGLGAAGVAGTLSSAANRRPGDRRAKTWPSKLLNDLLPKLQEPKLTPLPLPLLQTSLTGLLPTSSSPSSRPIFLFQRPSPTPSFLPCPRLLSSSTTSPCSPSSGTVVSSSPSSITSECPHLVALRSAETEDPSFSKRSTSDASRR